MSALAHIIIVFGIAAVPLLLLGVVICAVRLIFIRAEIKRLERRWGE